MRQVVIRAAVAAAAVLTSLAVTPGAASASGVGIAPYFAEYGSGMHVTVNADGTTSVPIGVMTWGTGTETGVKLTVDLSQITAKVDLVSVTSPCSRSGSIVTCSYGTLTINGEKKHGATMSLRAKAGAPAGVAGKVNLRVSASPAPLNPTTTGTVEISTSALADLVMTSTVPTADIGQTVTLTHTVRNAGPASEPWAILSADTAQKGTQFVGGDGCTVTASSFTCRMEDIAVGETRTVRVKVKINGCEPVGGNGFAHSGWAIALGDPNYTNNDFQVRVTVRGCPSTANPKPATTTPGKTTVTASASASPSPASPPPSLSSSPDPFLTPAAEASLPPLAEVATSTGTAWLAYATAAAAGAVLVAVGILVRRRRRAPIAAPTDGTDA